VSGERAARADLWESHAVWWQEGFTEGADAEYEEQILPMAAAGLAGCADVLDVGTGEGQVARLAVDRGATRVVGVDPTTAQVVEAVARGGGPSYARAGAAALPFPDARFDAVVACLVFEHIEDVDGAIGEVARVLRPGGRFLFFLNHPLLQTPGSGWIDDQTLDPPEQYWRIGPYLTEDDTVEEVEKDVFIPVHPPPALPLRERPARRRPALTRMEEPAPPPGFLARAASTPTRPPSRGCSTCAASGRERVSEFVVITGQSGAGRSQAANVLEDLGWFVIDNLPPAPDRQGGELGQAPGTSIARIALVSGPRPEATGLDTALAGLRRHAERVVVLFLTAADNVLVRRYEETRRRHPLAGGDRILDTVVRERLRSSR
jgi:SAM-dependent methyltransferase